MISKIRVTFVFVLILLCTYHLSSITTINPYNDPSKARVILMKNSIQNGDTVTVDEFYFLVVGVELKEFIDSFSISIEGNKKWKDTTIHNLNSMINPLPLSLEFYKTGQLAFEIKTFFKHKKNTFDTYTVYAKYTIDMSPTIERTNSDGDSIKTKLEHSEYEKDESIVI